MKATSLAPFPPGPDVSVNFPDLAGWIGWVFETIESWNQRHKARRQMAATDSRTLRDFGFSNADVFIETNKSFWEA